MKSRVVNRTIIVLTFAILLLGGLSDVIGEPAAPNFIEYLAGEESIERSVAENTPAGQNIGRPVSAIDDDEDRLTYALPSLGADKYDIDSTNGQLKTKAALDFETNSSDSVTIKVSDGTHDVLTIITINITNVNEAPWFPSATDTRVIHQGVAADTNIGSPVRATDPDVFKRSDAQNTDTNPETDDEDSLTYSLSGTDAESFSIDSATGQLKSSVALDYDTQSSYQITVEVSDGSLTDSIRVTIEILNVPEADHAAGEPASEPSQADALPPITSAEIVGLISLLSMDKVIFNEIYNASNDAHDWLELRNVSNADIDLSGLEFTTFSALGSKVITFPEGMMLPAGEVLLFVNTDPSAPESLLAASEEGAVHYVVDETFGLPQMDFALILRSMDGTYEDSVGNYFPNRPEKPDTAPLLTADVAWQRAKPAVIGYQAEAWIESGYQGGLGYGDGVSEDIGLGTPGYHRQQLTGDLNSDGVINILDLVLVASQFGEAGETAADLNGDGTVNIQDLVIVASGLGTAAAAPSAQTLHASHVQHWLKLAERKVGGNADSGLSRFGDRSYQEGIGDRSYEKGIEVLEQLLASLIPQSSALLPNYPNPFNPETWIPYRLAKPSDVQISIYDARGSVVRQLDLGHRSAGLYQTRSQAAYWDGTNDAGESVASGIYFYTLTATAGDFSATRKMLILK